MVGKLTIGGFYEGNSIGGDLLTGFANFHLISHFSYLFLILIYLFLVAVKLAVYFVCLFFISLFSFSFF
jgi:hypothetical protein